MYFSFSKETDLEIDRVLNVSPMAIWRCWSEPDLLQKWFCPKPALAEEARINPTPGGEFYTRLRSPNGNIVETSGCVLAASPARLMVISDRLSPGFHPRRSGFLTTVIMLSAEVVGTRYIARALHTTPDQKKKHEDMGFHDGWGRAITQLGELAQQLDRG
ncbi:SRPBCC domain-containing protein [Thalassovita sp.]|uniref:SRPBCC domain-containing protein n=1 Tax=Thalassovita sp. TaxID=1979401 RepID=UPI002B278616|nr:SRPBCC domain-containing protein [Thalassovita sp.]